MRLFRFFLCCLFPAAAFAQSADPIAQLMSEARYPEALATIDQRTKTAATAERVLLINQKAEVLIRMGRFDEAAATLDALGKSANPSSEAARLTTYGLLFTNQGRNDKAGEVLKRAISIYDSLGQANSLGAAQAISHLGLVYQASGKNTQAQEQLRMALSIRQNLIRGDHELIAASYNDLGLSFANVDNDKALDYYEKALRIYESLHGKDHPKIAIASINAGYIYRNLELYGDAVNNFEAALKIWERVYPQPHPQKAFALRNLGDTYLKMGDVKAARGYYDRALKMYRDAVGPKHPDVSEALNALGGVALSEGEFDQAIDMFQQAIIANIPDFNNPAEDASPPIRGFYNGKILLYSMLLKAGALERRYFEKTLRFRDMTLAIETLQRCDSLIDELRQHSANENDKIALGVIASEVYADGVRIAYGASQAAWKKKPFRELAFYFADKSKSAVLLEAISDSDAKSFAGIPATLMEQEKSLKSAIALTAQKLSQKPTADEEKILRESAYKLNRDYENFIRKLEADYPQYFNLKFNSSQPSVAEVQKVLEPSTALISYFIDEKNSRLYIFNIRKSKFEIEDKALPASFDKFVTGLRNSLYFNELRTYKRAASALSKILLPSRLPAGIQDAIFIPTGRMSTIPFETLLTDDAESASEYAALPYLINRISVRYEFSTALLLQKAKRGMTAQRPAILLCAPVNFPVSDNLASLPGTESEIREISRLFESKNFSASLNVGSQANESLVKKDIVRNYNVLHFATHGVVDETSPELSRIFLQSTSEAEDGHLFAGEIYNLTLDANLVTLSACQTGLGKISRGEGVIGLSRALVYAGARNIIVSYWSVSDDSTAELMKNFYNHLLNDSAAYTKSLRTSKLELIRGGKYAAPYYWAPFILIGY